MTKEAYLQGLWNALILRVDRAEAERLVTYYERTLAEAGAEGEARLMEQWGTPVLCVLVAASIYSGARQISRWMDWGAHRSVDVVTEAQTETTVLLPGEGDQAHVYYEYTLTPQEGVAMNGDAQESGWEGSVYIDESTVQIQ